MTMPDRTAPSSLAYGRARGGTSAAGSPGSGTAPAAAGSPRSDTAHCCRGRPTRRHCAEFHGLTNTQSPSLEPSYCGLLTDTHRKTRPFPIASLMDPGSGGDRHPHGKWQPSPRSHCLRPATSAISRAASQQATSKGYPFPVASQHAASKAYPFAIASQQARSKGVPLCNSFPACSFEGGTPRGPLATSRLFIRGDIQSASQQARSKGPPLSTSFPTPPPRTPPPFSFPSQLATTKGAPLCRCFPAARGRGLTPSGAAHS